MPQWFSKMSVISDPLESAAHAVNVPVKSRKPGVFSFIVAALHASRQRQAHQILRRCEHLIAPAAHVHELKQNSGDQR
jgi:phosphoglycerate-specific signal transduction histidine kinase